MNLRAIANSQTRAINPNITGTIQISTGSTTGPTGARTPLYEEFPGIIFQVQALSTDDLKQVDAINLGGERRSIYIDGVANAVVRARAKGGDKIILTTPPHAGVWLIEKVPEQWGGGNWVHFICVLQNTP